MKIFIADYVPLLNKGEEAIIRGIQSLFKQMNYDDVHIVLFDDVQEEQRTQNITRLPVDLLFPDIDKKHNKFKYILKIIKHKLLGRKLIKQRLIHPTIKNHIQNSDYTMVGHNGFFLLETLWIIRVLKDLHGKIFILGSGNPIPPFWKFILKNEYQKSLSLCEFCVYREKYIYDDMNSSLKINHIHWGIDPAFLMLADIDDGNIFLNSIDSFNNAVKLKKKIVGVTVLETGIAYNSAYKAAGTNLKLKREMHVSFMSKLLGSLIENENCYILFLPHSIEKKLYKNDMEISKLIVNELNVSDKSYCVIDKDLSPMLLKGIISSLDFLIAERTHSMIAALSTGTPFVGLTTNKDRRTHDIVGKQFNASGILYEMEEPKDAYIKNIIESVNSPSSKKEANERLERLTSYKQDYFELFQNIFN